MKLSKTIPARTETIEFDWCKRDWMQMSENFRRVRDRSRNKMTRCGWCRHAFKDGEMMALARPKKGGNKALCQVCAGKMLDE